MYQGFRTVLPASSVEGCCHGAFMGPGSNNLLVSKHNILELYTVVEGDCHPMILEKSTPLTQSIEAVERVRFPGREHDSVVVAFGEAKLSVMHWDPAKNDFEVTALHFLEEQYMQTEKKGLYNTESHLLLRVDPGGKGRSSQCLVLLVHRRFLFVLPFNQPSSGWGDSDSTAGVPKYPLQKGGLVDLANMDLAGVRDITFVEGYYQPTLMVLHEVEQTWAGRLVIVTGDDQNKTTEKKMLTVAATALTLSLTGTIECTNTPITTKIPYNAHKLVALQSEPYGALIVASNSLMHVSSSEHAGYAVHVNNYGKEEFESDTGLTMPFGEAVLKDDQGEPITIHADPRYPSSPAVRLCLDLTNCCLSYVSQNNYLLTTSGGDALLLTVVIKSDNVGDLVLQTARGLSLPQFLGGYSEGLVQLPSPSCTATLTGSRGRYVFIGSRMGDSVMLCVPNLTPPTFCEVTKFLSYAPIVHMAVGDSAITTPPQNSDNAVIDDELFPAPSLVETKAVELNPVKSDERPFGEKVKTTEVVAATGRDRDGAVCVLSRTIKPLALLTHAMPCKGVWSITDPRKAPGPKRNLEGEFVRSDGSPVGITDYLVMTDPTNTTVLECRDDDLVEVKEEGVAPLLMLKVQTVLVANVLDGKCVVQVTKTQVYLTDFAKQTYQLSIGDVLTDTQHEVSQTVRVHTAYATNERILLLMTDGTLRLVSMGFLEIEGEEKLRATITLPPLDVHRFGFVTACYLAEVSASDSYLSPRRSPGGPRTVAVVVTIKGVLQLYDVEQWTLLFNTNNIFNYPSILRQHSQLAPPVDTSRIDYVSMLPPPSTEHVVGVYVGHVSSKDIYPHLLLLTSADELHCYRAFNFTNPTDRLPSASLPNLHFEKTVHNYLSKMPEAGTIVGARVRAPDPANAIQVVADEDDEEGQDGGGRRGGVSDVFVDTPQQPRMTAFTGIHNSEGVYIRAGQGGGMAFSDRNHLRVHPFASQGSHAKGFAPLSTPFCPQGFTLGTTYALKVMRLSWRQDMEFAAPWPILKIPLSCSPHHVVYSTAFRTYTVVVSERRPFKPVKTAFDCETDVFLEGDTESTMKEVSPTSGIPVPLGDRYELRLYSSSSWKPFVSIPLAENETVLAAEAVQLSKTKFITPDSMVELQAFGTAFAISEDVPCRGRLLLYRVRSGNSRFSRELQFEGEAMTKGPVTAITATP
eukprot:Sspe_Gene.82556::Locus_54106_Transcript_1_1_Confidence_1.000_Length_3645::g.82556::m.82556/K14401/CPSF1, CFT1; cleavage and polyadenylation specificity factor subunit 1